MKTPIGITVPGVIDKADISVTHSLVGTINAREIILGTVTYAPRSLEFKGFQGAINMDDRRYHGTYVFGPVIANAQYEAIDFADIPHLNEGA